MEEWRNYRASIQDREGSAGRKESQASNPRCGGGKYSYATIRTLRKLAKPVVRKSGSKVKVSWKKLTGAKGYQVAVNGVNKATVTGASTRLTVNKGQKLKYKVRAYTKSGGKIIYGPWSAQKSFKLK